MAKRVKSSRTYQDSSGDYVEILGITQGSSAPIIFQSTASSMPAKRASAESSVIRHRYSYRGNSDAEYSNYDFDTTPSADNDDEDLSNVEFVEEAKPKIQGRRVGTSRGRRSATLTSSVKRTSVRSANKHQSQLFTTLRRSTKRTSVSSAKKHYSQISFILTRKASIKHTMYSTIHRKRQITTHNGLVPVQDIPFFYTPYHFSELQSCKSTISTVFYLF